MPGLQHIKLGDPVPRSASAWNTLVDAARVTQNSGRSFHSNPRETRFDSSVVVVGNDTNRDVPQYGTLQLKQDMLFEPAVGNDAGGQNDFAEMMFREQPVFRGIVPTKDGGGQFGSVIALEPIPSGRIGRALIGGAALTRVEYPDSNGARRYLATCPKQGEVGFQRACYVGPNRILWRQDPNKAVGSGKPWAIVRMGDWTTPTLSGSAPSIPKATTNASGKLIPGGPVDFTVDPFGADGRDVEEIGVVQVYNFSTTASDGGKGLAVPIINRHCFMFVGFC